MSSSNQISVAIKTLNYADISTCSKTVRAAFAIDPHTLIKQLGQRPYDMYAMAYETFLKGLERKTQIYVKAIEKETGNIIGHASWVFRGLDQNLIPFEGPRDEKPSASEGELPTKSSDAVGNELENGKDTKEKSSIERLHALEDADIQDWVDNQIPKDKPCIFINGLIVSPEYQSRGVGSALLQYGNDIADKLNLSIWVHSSHQAYEAYKKAGFEVVRVLDLDLDEYAPRPPREDEMVMEKGSGKWGKYIIRYMQRTPKAI